jgi:hypothetical protein
MPARPLSRSIIILSDFPSSIQECRTFRKRPQPDADRAAIGDVSGLATIRLTTSSAVNVDAA